MTLKDKPVIISKNPMVFLKEVVKKPFIGKQRVIRKIGYIPQNGSMLEVEVPSDVNILKEAKEGYTPFAVENGRLYAIAIVNNNNPPGIERLELIKLDKIPSVSQLDFSLEYRLIPQGFIPVYSAELEKSVNVFACLTEDKKMKSSEDMIRALYLTSLQDNTIINRMEYGLDSFQRLKGYGNLISHRVCFDELGYLFSNPDKLFGPARRLFDDFKDEIMDRIEAYASFEKAPTQKYEKRFPVLASIDKHIGSVPNLEAYCSGKR